MRPGDRDLVGEGSLAELADSPVELAQGTPHRDGQSENQHDGHRHQQAGLPQQAAARLQRLLLHRRHLGVDLRVGLLGHQVSQRREVGEAIRQYGGSREADAAGRAQHGGPDLRLQLRKLSERLVRLGVVHAAIELIALRGQLVVLLPIHRKQLGVVEHAIQQRHALE